MTERIEVCPTMGPEAIEAISREDLEGIYDSIIAGDTADELGETHLRRKDGSLLLVEARRQAKRFGADWVIVGVLRDITARKGSCRATSPCPP